MKILFVCHGNRKRDAAAELIARAKYPQFEVDSSGVAAKPGRITSLKMRQALSEAGYTNISMRSKMITAEQVAWADRVFYMDKGNERRFKDAFGNQAHAQRLSDYVEGENSIPNPGWCKDMTLHKRIVSMVEEALARLAVEHAAAQQLTEAA
jgi:protein-tyrosine-phosphatase